MWMIVAAAQSLWWLVSKQHNGLPKDLGKSRSYVDCVWIFRSLWNFDGLTAKILWNGFLDCWAIGIFTQCCGVVRSGKTLIWGRIQFRGQSIDFFKLLYYSDIVWMTNNSIGTAHLLFDYFLLITTKKTPKAIMCTYKIIGRATWVPNAFYSVSAIPSTPRWHFHQTRRDISYSVSFQSLIRLLTCVMWSTCKCNKISMVAIDQHNGNHVGLFPITTFYTCSWNYKKQRIIDTMTICYL